MVVYHKKQCFCNGMCTPVCLPIQMISVHQEERRRQLEVKLTVEEQLRLRREEEEEQARRKREEEQREMDERRKEAAKGIKRFNERVQSLRITDHIQGPGFLTRWQTLNRKSVCVLLSHRRQVLKHSFCYVRL